MTSDVATDLTFVDPDEAIDTYRVVLWAAPGSGKSVVAASAPGPLLVLSADRPSAYKFARKHYAGKAINEVRYRNAATLEAVYRHLREHAEINSVILDPFTNVYDALADEAPAGREGGPDYQWVNKKLLGFVKSLRAYDVNVILVAHEKLNDGKKGDGKLYPALGGPALINKVLAEVDICAHIEMRRADDGTITNVAQLHPTELLVCKESASGGALGARRIADLTRWFEVASDALAPDTSDLPWTADAEPANEPAAATSPPPAPAPAAPPPAGEVSAVAVDRALVTLLTTEDEHYAIRRKADARMVALGAPAGQRLHELQNVAGLSALVERVDLAVTSALDRMLALDDDFKTLRDVVNAGMRSLKHEPHEILDALRKAQTEAALEELVDKVQAALPDPAGSPA